MLKKYIATTFILSFIPSNLVVAQHPYANVTSADKNHLSIHFSIPEKAIRLTPMGNSQALEIDEFISNAHEGEVFLPQAALTFTLPENTSPEIRYNVLIEHEIYVENPARKLQKSPENTVFRSSGKKLVSMLQNGKIGNLNLCVLQINPARYDRNTRRFVVANKFTIHLSWRASFNTILQKPSFDKKNDIAANVLNDAYIGNWSLTHTLPQSLRKAQQLSLPDKFANILTREPGIHAVSLLELADAGLDLIGKSPDRLHLTYKNHALPLLLINSNKETLSENDYIVFRAEENHGEKTYLSQYAEKNVYQIWHGEEKGLYYIQFDGGLYEGDINPQDWYWDQKHFEMDQWFDRLLLQYDGLADHWFWSRLSANQEETVEFELEYPAAIADSTTFTFAFMGNTYPTYARTDHSVEVYVNNSFVAQGVWDGQKEYVITVQIPSNLLLHGKNQLTIKAPGNSEAGEIDQFYFNWMDVKYPRSRQVLDNNIELKVTEANAVLDYKVEGFTSDEIYVITSDGQQLLNFEQKIEESGRYSVRFQDHITRKDKIYNVFAKGAWKSPMRIDAYSNTDLRSLSNAADYIIIAHGDFISQIEQLATWRESRGYRVAVIDVQDVYNTFNGGNHAPEALRDFIKYAYNNWQSPKLKYVLFVGDGHYGFNKNRYNETINHVPTYMAFTSSWGLTSSDNFFAQVSGDDILPDVAIGRFACNTSEELQAMIDKTLNYEQNPNEGVWRSVINLSVGDDKFFEDQAEELNEYYIPEAYRVKRIYTREGSRYFGDTNVLVDLFNKGSLLMNFQGHGGGAVFFDSQLFLLEDIALLQNAERLPVLFSWSCFIGYFDNPHGTSLGEALAREPENGTVAGFGAAGRAWLFGDRYFNNILYQHLFKDKAEPLGEIIRRAKIDLFTKYGQRDLVLIYNLLGDPALKIQFPDDTLLVETQNAATGNDNEIDVTLNVPKSSGTVLIESFHDDDYLMSSDTLQVNSNAISHKINIPDTVSGTGLIRSFFWDNNTHAHGSTSFAIDKIYIGDLLFDPSFPTHQKPFHILIQPVSSGGTHIDSVWFKWQTKGSSSFDSTRFVSLVKNNNQYYQTPSPFQFSAGEQVNYQFKIYGIQNDSSFQILTDVESFTILLQSDLRFADANIQIGGENRTNLRFRIINNGQTQTENFSTSLYQRFVDGSERIELSNTTNLPLSPRDTQHVEIHWPSPKPGWNLLAIEIDPDRKADERYTSNNLWNLNLPVVTVNEGTGGMFYTPDSNVSLNIPPATLASNAILNVETWLNYGELINRLPSDVTPLPLKSGYHYFYAIDAGEKNTILGNNTKVRLYYNKADTAISNAIVTDELRVYYWDASNETFEIIEATHQSDLQNFEINLQKPGAIGFVRIKDKTSPEIEINVNGRRIIENEVIPVDPTFTILISDQAGISQKPGKLLLAFDEETLSELQYTVNKSSNLANVLLVEFTPEIQSGHHNLRIKTNDLNGNTTDREINFVVAEPNELISLANHPNPFRDNTIIAYFLSNEALEVKMDFYTVSGRRIHTMDFYNEQGYIEHDWDGRNEFGEEMANGVYYLRFTAKFAEKSVTRILKLARLQ